MSRAGLAVFAERFSFAAASELHGLEHWKRVGAVGAQLAAETLCADPAVIGAFSVFHDSQRRNDSDDPGHGARGAQLAAEMRRQGLLQLDDDQFALLVEACVGHTDGQTSFDPTVGCCWDADRLDLGRVGMRPAAEYLSTLAARRRVDVPTSGWRTWVVVNDPFDGLIMQAPYFSNSEDWAPGQPVRAECKSQSSHTPPDLKCGCGITALVTASEIRTLLEFGLPKSLPLVTKRGRLVRHAYAVGTVELPGRVILNAENELQAEEARISSLAIINDDLFLHESVDADALAQNLSGKYGVPVDVLDEIDELAPFTAAEAARVEKLGGTYLWSRSGTES